MSYDDAPSEPGLPNGAIIGDHFIIRRQLGGGGMGEVYLAENLNVPGRKYAVKVLRPEFSGNPRFVDLLYAEAEKQAKFQHANVGRMYDYFVWNGRYCLVQDFIEGKTLADMIAEQPAGLAWPVALPLMMGILDGLDYGHRQLVLHCDVKPPNVIVGLDGRPQVIDFGIAREIGPNARDSGLAGAGTAEYMSPEQVLPPYDIDHRSDVFAAGVLFYEMLSGRLPFLVGPEHAGPTLPQLHHDAPDVRSVRPDIPEPIARIVATALQRDPAARFQACSDFRRAIADYLQSIERRRIMRRVLPIALVILLVGGAGLYIWRERVKEEQRLEAELNEKRARQTAGEALANGVTSFNLLCREWIDYQIKKPGVEKARAAGFPDLVVRFEAKLAEMQANMDRHVTSYGDALHQLQSTQLRTVDAVLAAWSPANPADQRPADSVKTDIAALRAGRPVASKDELLGRCPAPSAAAGKSP